MLPVHVIYKRDPHEKQIHSEILRFVKRGGCRDVLHTEYVRICLDGSDMVLYQTFDNRIVSFLIADWEGPEMVTSAVCSDTTHGSAKELILTSFKIARARGLQSAQVHSVGKLLTYYPRFGYARVDESAENAGGGWLHVKNLRRGKNWYAPHEMSNRMKHYIRENLMKLHRNHGVRPDYPSWMINASNSEGSEQNRYSPRRSRSSSWSSARSRSSSR